MPSQFCLDCGTLLNPYVTDQIVSCVACRKQYPRSKFTEKINRTEFAITSGKEWKQKYQRKMINLDNLRTRMKVQKTCPKCDHPEMTYWALQTRSADEGSTVFYECEECQYTYSVNN